MHEIQLASDSSDAKPLVVGLVVLDPAHTAALRVVEAARGAEANGVEGMRLLSAAEAIAMEPNLQCTAALLSPSTGIIDSHSYMLALQGDAEACGAMYAFHSPVEGRRQ